MIAMAGILFKAVTGSFMGRALAIGLAALAALGLNNMYQRSVGRTQVVQASKKAGAKKNAKTREIRRRINPDNAMRRLRKEYSDRE